jgi:FixJ family two-component response regulator
MSLVGVVDDNEELCLSLVDVLRSIGYRAAPFDTARAFSSTLTDRVLTASSLMSACRLGRDWLDPPP